MGSEAISPDLIKKRMWLDYQFASSNPANEQLDCVHDLVIKMADQDLDMHKFLQDVADTMSRRLCIKEVTIGLRSPEDGRYRYEVMSGLEPSEWEAHKNLSYTRDQFYSQDVYKFKEISKYTRLYLAEDNPYGTGEEETYSKELMLKSVRKSLEDTIEGDYLDICIYGENDDLLGWIEISGLTNGKFPDVQTIKCVELLASVIGVVLLRSGSRVS
ncbi:MAG: hypothetical protein ACUVT7_00640 [Thermoplasmata archaeon]